MAVGVCDTGWAGGWGAEEEMKGQGVGNSRMGLCGSIWQPVDSNTSEKSGKVCCLFTSATNVSHSKNTCHTSLNIMQPFLYQNRYVSFCIE